MAERILLRSDTSINWQSVNPILGLGEVGFESDTNKFKIGDGTTAWANLSYFGGEVDLSSYLTQASASTTYLTQASASTTYLTQASASTTYLTESSASALFLTQNSASTNYLDKTDASVTTATASASVVRNITLSTSNPTGGNDGDIWMVYT